MKMSEINARLLKCFKVSFSEISPDDLLNASVVSMPEWDSLATVTLMSLIEEEFEISISMNELEFFVSFAVIEDLISRKFAVA